MAATNFPHSVLSAQSTFRAILDATARPGSVQSFSGVAEAPSPLSPGAAAIALALCDHDTPVWIDSKLSASAPVREWLRFYCGCPIAQNPREAAFAFAADPGALPPFEAFNLGTADYPDRSTTVVLQMQSFDIGPRLTLTGPGIRDRATFRADPLPADIAARLRSNRELFPRGIDLMLVTHQAVAALPRSVQIAEESP
jgi:alpha-D-ribose 1-methylphosphonate 5-triphosphate synthase subunit PhnH